MRCEGRRGPLQRAQACGLSFLFATEAKLSVSTTFSLTKASFFPTCCKLRLFQVRGMMQCEVTWLTNRTLAAWRSWLAAEKVSACVDTNWGHVYNIPLMPAVSCSLCLQSVQAERHFTQLMEELRREEDSRLLLR